MNSQDENSWRTPTFRQNVVSKIEEAIQNSGMPTNRSSVEMEGTVFHKSKSKDDYLGYVARLILHIRESMNKKLNNGSDPMNALRAMAQPAGATNPMMNMPQQNMQQTLNPASNLLQTLNQGRSTMQNRMPGIQPGGMNQMMGSLGPMQTNSMLHRAINQIPMNNQMSQNVNAQMPGGNVMVNQQAVGGPMIVPNLNNQIGMPNQMQTQMSGPMGNQITGPMSNQFSGSQLPPPIMGSTQQPHPSPMNVHLSNQRKMVPDNMLLPNQIPYTMPVRGPVQNQFLRQSTPPPNVSPVPMSSVNSMNSLIPSPVMVPSPNNSLQVPSSSGLVSSVMRQTASAMVPSPSSVTLNTPGNPSQMTPSPLSIDEQAYRDKIKQLSKYIEPLRRMISRFGNGDHENKIKMKKLLEVLSSTGQRSSLEVLLRCEAVLEKMDLKGMAEMKEQHPLIEAISVTLQNANHNHTFHRTFESVMATLNGKPLKSLPRPLKRKYVEEPTQDIPEALQGEVARLDQRFKVSLDPVHQKSSKCVYLLCWLDDRHLPCIPPVQITIPEDYPNSSPKCNLSNYEYGATKFLQMVQEALQQRISKLPSKYTMSQLLDTWENSVRESCSRERISNLDSIFVVS